MINLKKYLGQYRTELWFILFTAQCFLASFASANDNTYLNPYPQVKMETSMGNIIVELDRNKAPITVNNFLGYVNDKAYDNSQFHRVISNFVVQGGGLSADYKTLSEKTAIANESGNGLKNERGTIAMARSYYPHSATRQFYFNLTNNNQLDPSSKRWGYAVFGEVIEGINVLQAMSEVQTGVNRQINQPDVPLKPIILKSVTLLSK